MLLETFGRPAAAPLVRKALLTAGALVDVTVVRAAQVLAKQRSRRAPALDERRAYLDGIAARYGAVDPSEFYRSPPPIAALGERHVRGLAGGGDVVDWTWQSHHHPYFDDQRAAFERWPEIGTVHVRRFRQPRRGAPHLVAVHGYRAGAYAFEERAWQAEWLHSLGLDVSLYTLPFHALRAPAGRKGAPLFPTADVARTNETFGKIVWELRMLIDRLRADGAGPVGIAGMSLGGYTTAVMATQPLRPGEPPLAFAIPFVPLADMTDVVVDHEALRGVAVPRTLADAGRRAMALHRPLGRAPMISGDRVLVIAADADRITEPTHAQKLADHFGAALVRFPGAHLLQFGRRVGFSAMAKHLARLGLVDAR
jgi:hypothetical protein